MAVRILPTGGPCGKTRSVRFDSNPPCFHRSAGTPTAVVLIAAVLIAAVPTAVVPISAVPTAAVPTAAR